MRKKGRRKGRRREDEGSRKGVGKEEGNKGDVAGGTRDANEDFLEVDVSEVDDRSTKMPQKETNEKEDIGIASTTSTTSTFEESSTSSPNEGGHATDGKNLDTGLKTAGYVVKELFKSIRAGPIQTRPARPLHGGGKLV